MDPLGGFSSISGRDILTWVDQDGIHGIGPKPHSAGHCNFLEHHKGVTPHNIHGAWGGRAEVHRPPSSVWLAIMDPLVGFSSISGRDILTRVDQDGIHGIGPKPHSAGHCNFRSTIKGYPPINRA